MIPFDQYPVRVAAIPGESLAGYVHRFYANNGMEIPRHVWALLEPFYYWRSWRGSRPRASRVKKLDQLEQLLGTHYSIDRDWLLHGKYANRKHWGWSIPLKICAYCMEEFGAHLAMWELPFAHVCPRHEVLLLNKCLACQSELRWWSIDRFWRCRCSKSLLSHVVINEDPADRQLSALVMGASDMQRPPGYAEEDFQVPGVAPMPFALAYQQISDAWALGHEIAIEEQGGVRRVGRTLVKYYLSERPGPWELELLRDWPVRFEAALIRQALRYWDKGCGLIVVVEPKTPPGRMVSWLERGKFEWSPPDEGPQSEAFRTFMERLRLPIASRHTVLFNPSIGPRARHRRLVRFKLWWVGLIESLEKMPNQRAVQTTPRKTPSDPEMTCERVAIIIVSYLLEAAHRQLPAEVCAEAFDGLRLPSEGEPLDLVFSLTRTLSAMPWPVLEEVTFRWDAAFEALKGDA